VVSVRPCIIETAGWKVADVRFTDARKALTCWRSAPVPQLKATGIKIRPTRRLNASGTAGSGRGKLAPHNHNRIFRGVISESTDEAFSR